LWAAAEIKENERRREKERRWAAGKDGPGWTVGKKERRRWVAAGKEGERKRGGPGRWEGRRVRLGLIFFTFFFFKPF
jgi:hypothetical protein